MTEHQTSRTLVKSAPELWAECSDAASLARHLGAFEDIRITKLEPETAVAWEGAAVRGTVRLEPAGWGTRVTLTTTEDPGEECSQAAAQQPTVEPVTTAPPARPGLLARLARMLRFRTAEEPIAIGAAGAAPVPSAPEPRDERVLVAALDSLGRAHHRPYSRAEAPVRP
ncbi:MAG: hypothetical protein WAL63_20075 [Solirubrobacteraceae bacterium]